MPSPRRFLILIALGAVAAGFAPSSIQFLFMAVVVVGLTITCLKEASMNEDKYLSQPQAANYLGMSVATIQRRIADGTLPAYRSGHMVRVKLSDLEAMMTQIQPEPAAASQLGGAA